MKKIAILATFLFVFSSAFAQMGKVRSAYINYQEGNISKAQNLIDEAITHPKSVNNAMTWLYRGDIYVGIAGDITGLLNRDGSALAKAIEAYGRAKELDVENEYEKEILKGYASVASAKYNEAVKKYNEKTYNLAGDLFSESYFYAKIGNVIDTSSVYNSAVSYNLAKLPSVADKWYGMLVNMNYDKSSIYSEYANILNELEQFDKALEICELGMGLYPEDHAILIAEANIFLKTEQTEKALINLEKAASFESGNFSIYHAIGTMYNIIFVDTLKTEKERFLAYDKAVVAYKKVIEMDSTYFDAVYNLGAIIFNKGVYYLNVLMFFLLAIKNTMNLNKKEMNF